MLWLGFAALARRYRTVPAGWIGTTVAVWVVMLAIAVTYRTAPTSPASLTLTLTLPCRRSARPAARSNRSAALPESTARLVGRVPRWDGALPPGRRPAVDQQQSKSIAGSALVR